ncbi:MAG: RT0821/Lpp0805 family surface protein, partial [bacterium]
PYRYRRFYGPRVIFYNCYGCGGYYRRHQHYNHYHPAYRPSSTTVYSSGTTYSGGGGQLLGAILGGIGGGVIGHQIGGGSGKAVATVAGSVIGLLVGGEIGRQLDERGRLIMARTTSESLESSPSGAPVPWRDPDSGTYGTVTPRPAYQNARGEYCREYQQTVTIGGETKSAYGTACRNGDGSWRFAPTR